MSAACLGSDLAGAQDLSPCCQCRLVKRFGFEEGAWTSLLELRESRGEAYGPLAEFPTAAIVTDGEHMPGRVPLPCFGGWHVERS